MSKLISDQEVKNMSDAYSQSALYGSSYLNQPIKPYCVGDQLRENKSKFTTIFLIGLVTIIYLKSYQSSEDPIYFWSG